MDSHPQHPTSVILGLRTFTVLACLVLVPLAAIFGSSLPDLVSELRSRKPDQADESVVWNMTAAPAAPQAAKFDPFAAQPRDLQTAAGPVWATGPQAPGDVLPAGFTSPSVVQAGAASQPGLALQASGAAVAAPGWGGAIAPAANAHVNYETPISNGNPAQSAQSMPPAAVAVQPVPSPPSPMAAQSAPQSPEKFTWMEGRLRELGATYYLLESWGQGGGLFRFHCKMAIAGNAQLTRPFEVVDADPLKAMEHVLADVEIWRNGQHPR